MATLERQIQSQVKEQGELFEAIVDSAMAFNRQVWVNLAKADLGRLLFAPIHGRLGGNVRFLVSGGAALPPETHVHNGLGLFLTEGYGLTEAAPY